MPGGEQMPGRGEGDIAAGLRGPTAGQVACQVRDQLPGSAAETADARQALALLRAEHARLITAARASVTAARAGSANPLAYVEAEMTRRGGLPPQDAAVPVVLADTGTAMMLTGWAPKAVTDAEQAEPSPRRAVGW
jgi:hypothetical protein